MSLVCSYMQTSCFLSLFSMRRMLAPHVDIVQAQGKQLTWSEAAHVENSHD